jgi:hypothetical protein
MSIDRCLNVILPALMALGITTSSALPRPWKPTATQLASEYAQINDQRSNTEFVNIKWWAAATAASGTPLAGILEKYVLISVAHAHVKQPQGSISFDVIDSLEVRDSKDKLLTLVPRKELPPVAVGVLSTIEASFRQSLGRAGDGTQFFIFDAGAVRACDVGRLSVLYANETYTWDTPFPGCAAP